MILSFALIMLCQPEFTTIDGVVDTVMNYQNENFILKAHGTESQRWIYGCDETAILNWRGEPTYFLQIFPGDKVNVLIDSNFTLLKLIIFPADPTNNVEFFRLQEDWVLDYVKPEIKEVENGLTQSEISLLDGLGDKVDDKNREAAMRRIMGLNSAKALKVLTWGRRLPPYNKDLEIQSRIFACFHYFHRIEILKIKMVKMFRLNLIKRFVTWRIKIDGTR